MKRLLLTLALILFGWVAELIWPSEDTSSSTHDTVASESVESSSKEPLSTNSIGTVTNN